MENSGCGDRVDAFNIFTGIFAQEGHAGAAVYGSMSKGLIGLWRWFSNWISGIWWRSWSGPGCWFFLRGHC